MTYDIIIGLEIHAELKTKSKMFCACANFESENTLGNTAICPICLAHPGALPQPNQAAIAAVVLAGLALNCKINTLSKFDRKNYFYPDLPKGYQISQYDLPLAYSGTLDEIDIVRIHLEEDTAKMTHDQKTGETLIDFNRAGVPLLEMVTAPQIKTALGAKKLCQHFQQILRYLEISDADMEKGQMRCEANISLQVPGTWKLETNSISGKDLSAKVEVKNINSFKAVERAIEFEIKRQTELLDQGKKIIGETRGYNDQTGETYSQRLKESSADYRYFPEPDIKPLNISEAWIAELKTKLVELPLAKVDRFVKEYGLTLEQAEIISADKNTAIWFEEVASELRTIISGNENVGGCRLIANWLLSELFKYQTLVSAHNFAELMGILFNERINSSAGQQVLAVMVKTGKHPEEIIKELDLEMSTDDEFIKTAVIKIISENPSQVGEYRLGKLNVIQFLVGKVMAETKGRANPQLVRKFLEEAL